MKRKIVLAVFVFLFNIVWVNAINVTNKLASHYNFVIKTSVTDTNFNSSPNIIDELDAMLETNLYYENEDADVIAQKINLYLKNEMQDYGNLISKYSIVNEVNPYLIASMIIETTNCDSKCSVLVTKCNNVYQAPYQKDANQLSCFGGYYQKFATIDDSIKNFIKFIKINFYNKDLKTANSIAKSYNKDARWVFIINQTISQIKNSNV